MISKTHKGVPLVQIDNLHTPECGAPPTVDATGKFVSYFENRFGEQWVLVGDKASGKAVVYTLATATGGSRWRFRLTILIPARPCRSPKRCGLLPALQRWETRGLMMS